MSIYRREEAGRRLWAVIPLLLALALAGCAKSGPPERVSEPTMYIGEKGEIRIYMVEEFDKELYSVEDLTAMVEEELAQWNVGGQERIRFLHVGEAAEDAKNLMLVLEYADWKAYAEHTGLGLYVGPVAQAGAQGISIQGQMADPAQEGGAVDVQTILGYGQSTLIMVEDKMKIISARPVRFLSSQAQLLDAHTVDNVAVEGMTYIVCK